MTLYNIGTFETKTDSEMRELISIINQVGLGTMTCDEKNICKTDCRYSLEVSECEGDLDPALT